VNTAIQEAVFTLDNTKFWYIKFVYDFIYRYIELSKIYFIKGDADSLYYAISENQDEDCHQGFKHVIKDEDFYKENMFKWFPNPTLAKEELTRDKKKLLGMSFEKEGYIMFTVAQKCYIFKSSKNDNNKNLKKMKGVSFILNDNIELESYKSCLDLMIVESDPYSHTRHTVKYEQKKKAINGSALDKMIVLENHSCAPFLPNLTNNVYYFSK
jgi:hypothetical protein